jgi:hypothetical protein
MPIPPRRDGASPHPGSPSLSVGRRMSLVATRVALPRGLPVSNGDACPKCGSVEIRLIYKRSPKGDEWIGKCWDCQNEWEVEP